jgi:pyoverdine/dityrosine biosynthesis protein Dit1
MGYVLCTGRRRGKKIIRPAMQSKTQNGRNVFVKNMWPNMNEQIALRKILTGNKVTKL